MTTKRYIYVYRHTRCRFPAILHANVSKEKQRIMNMYIYIACKGSDQAVARNLPTQHKHTKSFPLHLYNMICVLHTDENRKRKLTDSV